MPKPTCILIVDDEPNVRFVFRTALETAGYSVSEAGDGSAALAHLRRQGVDLVLLDLRMPDLDGVEVLRQARSAGVDVPMVLVTAHGSIPDVVAAMKLGAADFLPKPVTPTSLREVVAEVLARCGVQAPAPDPDAGRSGSDSPAPLFVEDLARARRAIDRREFDEAEFFLRIAEALRPGSPEVGRLRDDIQGSRGSPGYLTFRHVGTLLS